MKSALKIGWRWLLGVILTLLGFSSCSKPEPVPVMYGPDPDVFYLMYGPRPASYETRSSETPPQEELSQIPIPEAEVPEKE